MPVTVTTVGPFYLTPGSEITFSSLRENFKGVGIGSINASSLLRDARPTSKNPIVPDSTENAGISSNLDWKISQFRPAIKYYNITHIGTETNYDLSASLSWNNNLSKTIVKTVNLDGTYGSLDVNTPSVKLEAETRNVKLYVNGEILGAGGKAGTPSNTELKGGDALSIKSDGNEVVVVPKGSIYGGGGGGAKGSTGLQGSSGSCSYYSYYTATTSCGPLPTCGEDYLESSSSLGSCNCNTFCVEVYFDPPAPPAYYPPYFPPTQVFAGTSCPDPEMPILMADGSQKKAGDIQVGDEVLTQHEKTLKWGKHKVIRQSLVYAVNKYKMIFSHEESTKEIICSDSHRFYVDGKEWIKTSEMISGDIVSGHPLISYEEIGDGMVVQMEIEEAHTYICNGLLSHNKTYSTPSAPYYPPQVSPPQVSPPAGGGGGRRRRRGGGGGGGGGGGKSDIRLKTNIRDIKSLFEI